jgi:hypothetical protein
MLSIADGEALSRALNSPVDDRIKSLLLERQDQLGHTIWDTAGFVIVQPSDSLADLEKCIGFSVFQNPVDGSRFGEPDYTPAWEWIEDHGFAFEAAFILTDDFAHVLVVQKQEGVPAELLDLCTTYASEHA